MQLFLIEWPQLERKAYLVDKSLRLLLWVIYICNTKGWLRRKSSPPAFWLGFLLVTPLAKKIVNRWLSLGSPLGKSERSEDNPSYIDQERTRLNFSHFSLAVFRAFFDPKNIYFCLIAYYIYWFSAWVSRDTLQPRLNEILQHFESSHPMSFLQNTGA